MNSPDFAKVFVSILDSSIANNWRSRHLFEDLLKLADWQGRVDMTPEAIARRTGWPHGLDSLRDDLAVLSEPDPDSRTPDEEGRRIVPLDPARPWGWRIVNIEAYRKQGDIEQVREKGAERSRAWRAGSDRPVSAEAAAKVDMAAAGRLMDKLEESAMKDLPPPQMVVTWLTRHPEDVILDVLVQAEADYAGKSWKYFAAILSEWDSNQKRKRAGRAPKRESPVAEQIRNAIPPLPEAQGWTISADPIPNHWQNVLSDLRAITDDSDFEWLQRSTQFIEFADGYLAVRVPSQAHADEIRERWGSEIVGLKAKHGIRDLELVH